ncbi:SDR family NAD(P)-dependent oxidoreductase [Streptomyces triticagri]|uniref:SDR family NAD(P)-dependent oxidoreductase n=1 Tax=Streptomyces triticagri TaxID=2293568 RepID=A0A372LX65_9ACTN|nr:SDR family NAD(P)-dependent oxidoreductase [Streptomyces triticagri]RFU83139.1 SDR family NAD(P)-dependent oxidoreductase [Streptomyces triticagri]
MTTDSAHDVTLITGGSTGIGAAAARRLLARGGRVAVTGRDGAKLDRLAAEFDAGDALLTLPGDAADSDAVAAAVAATVKEYGRLDTVVANAGFAGEGTVADGDPEVWRAMVLTNVLGPALLIRHALPALKETRGRIILIGSVAGLVNTPGNVYGATKWAVTGLAENTRRLVTGDEVGVTLVAPGRVDTPFWDGPGPNHEGILLDADRIADSIVWAIDQPAGVDINTLTIRPKRQPN